MNLITGFVPYLQHKNLERPGALEQKLAKAGRLEDCAETLLSIKRWEQYLAAASLEGSHIKIVDGEHEMVICVVRVERCMNAATECFILVSGAGIRYSITPNMDIFIGRVHVE